VTVSFWSFSITSGSFEIAESSAISLSPIGCGMAEGAMKIAAQVTSIPGTVSAIAGNSGAIA